MPYEIRLLGLEAGHPPADRSIVATFEVAQEGEGGIVWRLPIMIADQGSDDQNEAVARIALRLRFRMLSDMIKSDADLFARAFPQG